jgi:hypothetical protein
MALAQSTPPTFSCWVLPPVIRSFFLPARHRLPLQMPPPPSPVVSDAPSPTVRLPILYAASPAGLVYPLAPDTREFLPLYGTDIDRFLHGQAFANRVYTPYPRELYRDISPDVGSFHPSVLNYDRLTRIGMAARIRDFTLDKCPSFRADFHPLMPAYFKVGDRVYLETRDYLGAGHVDQMVLHDSDLCTYLVVGYCYNRMEPSDCTCWFHITVHAAVALPRYMPQNNDTFYGITSFYLPYHYSYHLDWFFARYTFQAPRGRSQAEPGEKHEDAVSSRRSSQRLRRERKGK